MFIYTCRYYYHIIIYHNMHISIVLACEKLTLPKTKKALKLYYFLFMFSGLLFVDIWHHFSTVSVVTIIICYTFTFANWISMTIWVLYQDIFIYLHIPMIRNALCKVFMNSYKYTTTSLERDRGICCFTFTYDKDRLRNNI